MTDPTLPGAPVSGQRRARPTASIPNDVEMLADHKVGHSREKIESDRRARPRRRLVVGLVVIASVGGMALLYASSSAKKHATGPALNTAKATSATGETDLDASLRGATNNRGAATALDAPSDSFPSMELTGATPTSPKVRGTIGPVGGAPRQPTTGASGDLLPPPPGTTRAVNGTTGSTSAGGNGSTTSSGGALPGTRGATDIPLLPPDAQRGAVNGPPSLSERMKGAKTFSVQSTSGGNGNTPLYPVRHSALIADATTASATGIAGSASAASDPATWKFTPGAHVSASIGVASPSAASGEPIIATLDEPLIERGVTLLPAGTRAIGTGGAWDDGSGHPRLNLTFTTFVLPDNSTRSYSARAYSPSDERPGIVVPYNHQYVRKGGMIAGAAAAAAAFAKIMPSQTQTVSGLSVQVDPTYQARQQAATDVYGALRQEMNLTRPAVSILFELAAGTKITLVFGMP